MLAESAIPEATKLSPAWTGPDTPTHCHGRARTETVAWTLLLLGCFLLYWYTATAGQWSIQRWPWSYFDLLAESFAEGRLDLKADPNPALLELPDPYDPRVNASLKLHDASLYNGRYYLYWGPAPALIHALIRPLTGGLSPTQMVHIFFGALTVGLTGLLLAGLRRRHFPAAPTWLPLALTAVIALGPTQLYLVSRPSVYNEPYVIANGLLAAFWAIHLPAMLHRGPTVGMMTLAGACLGVAVASRLLAVVYLAGPLILLALLSVKYHRTRITGALVRSHAALLAPISLVLVLLGLYNLARFGSPFDVGQGYALLSGVDPYAGSRDATSTIKAFFNGADFWRNLIAYGISAPLLLPASPYAWPGFSAPYQMERTYVGIFGVNGPIISLLAMAPGVAAGGLVLLCALVRAAEGATRQAATIIVICLLGNGLVAMAIISAGFLTTMRYTGDFSLGILLAGAIGVLQLFHWLSWDAAAVTARPARVTRWLLSFAVVASLALTAVFGACLTLWGWYEEFRPEAATAYRAINRVTGALAIRLNPELVRPQFIETDEAPWRLPNLLYAPGTRIYLRAPHDDPVLHLSLISGVQPPAVLRILVSGAEMHSARPPEGPYEWTSPPLIGVPAGAIVPVEFDVKFETPGETWTFQLPILPRRLELRPSS